MKKYLTLIVGTALVSLIFLIPKKAQGMNEEFSRESQEHPSTTHENNKTILGSEDIQDFKSLRTKRESTLKDAQEKLKEVSQLSNDYKTTERSIQDEKRKLFWLNQLEYVFNKLKENNVLSESAYVKKVIEHPGSATAAAIIFIGIPDSPTLVAKVFSYPLGNNSVYEKEYKNMKRADNYIKMINEIKTKYIKPLPIIVALKRAMDFKKIALGVLLMEEAQGMEFSYYVKNLPYMEDTKIKEIYQKLGEQFGALDALMLEHTGKILVHNNIKEDNFFYDETHNQIYIIDLGGDPREPFDEGIALRAEKNGLKYLESLFHNPGRGSSIYYKDADTLASLTAEQADGVRKNLLAQNSFAQSYYQKNKNNKVKEEYNARIAANGYIAKVISSVNKALKLSQPLDIKDYMLS